MRRYSDFQAHLDIPEAVLAERLNGLVEDKADRAPLIYHAARRRQYALTPIGVDLSPALTALIKLGDRHRAANSRIFKHAAWAPGSTTKGSAPGAT